MSKDLIGHDCKICGALYLNAYAGGKHGRCVQLTTTKDYVQMTFAEAKAFFAECISAIEKTEREYNENPPWWEKIIERRRTNNENRDA